MVVEIDKLRARIFNFMCFTWLPVASRHGDLGLLLGTERPNEAAIQGTAEFVVSRAAVCRERGVNRGNARAVFTRLHVRIRQL